MPVYRVLPERLRVLSLQAERPLTPSIPLLIRGFGVRFPGGAPVDLPFLRLITLTGQPGLQFGLQLSFTSHPTAPGRSVLPHRP